MSAEIQKRPGAEAAKGTNKFVEIIKYISSEYVIIYAVIALSIVLSLASDVFLTTGNIMNVLRQTSMIAILAAGIFFVMVGGGMDISVGATVGLSGIAFASALVNWGWHPLPAFIFAILVGCLAGVVNAFMVTKAGIPPFIATLGMMSAARGLIYVVTNAYPISGLPKSIAFIGRGYWLGIPFPVIIMAVVYLVAHFVSQKTKFGRFVYASGGNVEAAYLSGIKVKKIIASTYIICAALAALSGVILVSRLDSGQPNAGLTWEFEAITAAVIGGVSITGGKGKVLGVFFGAILIGLLTNGMTLLNVSSYYQQIIKGAVLAGAIGLDVYKTKKANKV
ncbi:MAG TPA: ABC transporter permease [Clostridiaceae bacterium]|nr:ABC transporter permease [Clostridiaceae bacterium]